MGVSERGVLGESPRVVLNIGGAVYETRIQTLERYPNTLLGNPSTRNKYYCSTTGQYFFNRSRIFFDAILFFYQSGGMLSCPLNTTYTLFEDECRFFKLPKEAIRLIRPEELRERIVSGQKTAKSYSLRARIWYLMQNPKSSQGATLFSFVSSVLIGISVISSCLETVPALQTQFGGVDPWGVIEMVLNSIFLIELILGTICSPNLWNFSTSFLTLVDIIAVVPYFITIILESSHLNRTVGCFRTLRIFRLTKLLKLSKHSGHLEMVGRIIISCAEEFKTLVFCLWIVVTLAASCINFLEGHGLWDEHGAEEEEVSGDFSNVPQCMYWAVQTLSTVGYGDICPSTFGGKVFASAFMLFGMASVSIPILSIVAKFERIYFRR